MVLKKDIFYFFTLLRYNADKKDKKLFADLFFDLVSFEGV